MKSMILTGLIMLSSSAFAQDVVLKECTVSMQQFESGKIVDMTIKVISKGTSLSAVVTQTIDGISGSYSDVAEIQEQSVRANLTAQSNTNDLNQAEALIVHAMMLTEDPVFDGAFSAGLDLKQVRFAKMFTVGEKTNMGSSTILEARGASNQILGSFLGGFVVTPCK